MKKNRFLYLLLIFLVIANGYLLYNQFNGKGKRGHRESRKDPVEFISKKLEFNDQQVAQLKEISVKHREKVQEIYKETKLLKSNLFNAISNTSVNQNEIDSIINLIGEKTKYKETEMFFHLRGISDICNDDQKEKFENMLKHILDKRGKRGGSGSRHRF